MSILRADETDLLLALHASPLEGAPWEGFLARLRQRLGADRAALAWRAGASEAAGLPVEWQSPPDKGGSPGLVGRAARTGDPLRLLRLRPGRVYALADLADPTQGPQAAWLAEAQAEGQGEARIVQVAGPDGGAGWLSVTRARGTFPALASATLSDLAPHLALALRAWVVAEASVRARALAEAAAERLGFGLIWLARDGTVVQADAGARSLAAACPGLRLAEGARLAPASAAGQRALTRALAPAAAPRAVLLHEEPRLDLLIEDRGPLLAGFLRAPREGALARSAAEAIASLFALTPAESRLAAALASGDSLEEAGERLGLARETARTYSKALYRKTGTRGMTDLVRRLRDSAALFCPD